MISYYIDEFLILNINFEPINIDNLNSYCPVILSEKFKNIYDHLLFKLLNFRINDKEYEKIKLSENHLILYIGYQYFFNLDIHSNIYRQHSSYILKCVEIFIEFQNDIKTQYLNEITKIKCKNGFYDYKLIEINEKN